ncbi:MAG TPA: benenodin family lasso peptide [Allosphingosinicella sp.]|jgi:hypothetical protein
MQKNEDRELDLIELGSVTGDTQGRGGPYAEFVIGMTKNGISED